MDWETLIGIAASLAFGAVGFALRFAIRQALCAKQAAAQVELDLAAFKTEVAKGYVSTAALDKLEKRIMDALGEMTRKIDLLFDGIRGER